MAISMPRSPMVETALANTSAVRAVMARFSSADSGAVRRLGHLVWQVPPSRRMPAPSMTERMRSMCRTPFCRTSGSSEAMSYSAAKPQLNTTSTPRSAA